MKQTIPVLRDARASSHHISGASYRIVTMHRKLRTVLLLIFGACISSG